MSLRPHGYRLSGPAAVLIVTLGVGAFVAARLPEGRFLTQGRLAVALVATAVVLRWALLPYLRWLSTRVLVTDRRIVVRTGLLTRSGRDLPLGRVADIAQRRRPLQRLVGCGTLVVDATGERGRLVLRDVPRIEQVSRELHDLVDRFQARSPDEAGRGSP